MGTVKNRYEDRLHRALIRVREFLATHRHALYNDLSGPSRDDRPRRGRVEAKKPYLESYHRNPWAQYATDEEAAVAEARANVAELLDADTVTLGDLLDDASHRTHRSGPWEWVSRLHVLDSGIRGEEAHMNGVEHARHVRGGHCHFPGIGTY